MEAAAVSLLCHHAAAPPPTRGGAPAPPEAPLPRLRLARPGSSTGSSPADASSSSRAATGYAAALADACAAWARCHGRLATRATYLLRFPGRHHRASESDDARVAVLVRMLVAKGKTGMVADVMAEFAAICCHLLPNHAMPTY